MKLCIRCNKRPRGKNLDYFCNQCWEVLRKWPAGSFDSRYSDKPSNHEGRYDHMNLKRAIEILKREIPPGPLKEMSESARAHLLLIEAGERIEGSRHINGHPGQALLPGETLE